MPARGGVFDFQVYVSLTWTTQSLRPDELKDWARELWVLPYREVKRMATDLAARYAPYRAADLEARLNRRLASRPRQFHRSRNTVDCRSEVNVRLDDRLRKHLQPVWEKMAVMEAEHEVNRRRAELVADLNHRWLAILEQLPDTAVAPAAARLTDRQFADVVRQLAEDRRDTVDRLMAVLEILRRDGQANDRASGQIIELLISALRDQLGGLAEKSRRGRSNTPPWPRTDPDSTR